MFNTLHAISFNSHKNFYEISIIILKTLIQVTIRIQAKLN